jgi:hypothetical protein
MIRRGSDREASSERINWRSDFASEEDRVAMRSFPYADLQFASLANNICYPRAGRSGARWVCTAPVIWVEASAQALQDLGLPIYTGE